MARRRYSKRDDRFQDWRRNATPKGGALITMPLYSVDLDSLEYRYVDDVPAPVALLEYKHLESSWQDTVQPGMNCHAQLCRHSNLPYFVVSHATDWHEVYVYRVNLVSRNGGLDWDTTLELEGGLYDFVLWLCHLRDYDPPTNIKEFLIKVYAIDEDGQDARTPPKRILTND